MKKIYSFLPFFLFALVCFSQKNITYESYLPYPVKLNDIWGYVDTSGKEYALVGTEEGTSIVDVSSPQNPEELFFIPGPKSVWRDLKTWKHYAYITHDYSSDTLYDHGLLIIDLSMLPDSISSVTWTGDTLGYERAHNLYIDSGYAYLFGSNLNGGGALILDLTTPLTPLFVGSYSDEYLHDGYVRNNTLYGSAISNGHFSVIDISDKANPIQLTTTRTPNAYTHNCWLSDNGNTLFTTDERPGSFVAAYDISDLDNITKLDQYQSNPGKTVIPHNTHVFNDYVVTSYYRDGVTVVDAHNPNILVEVGNFDTSPFSSDEGFQGCWGAYPYLPSGTLLATDREEGLFILTPQYQRASYLVGSVTDTMGNNLIGALVEVLSTKIEESVGIDGTFQLGVADSGSYTIRVTYKDCMTKIIPEISLQTGETTQLDIQLTCPEDLIIDTPTTSLIEKENDISFYAAPNYFYENTTLNIKQNYSDNLSLVVYNINGQVLFRQHVYHSSYTLQFGSNLSKGIYFATLENRDSRKTITLVKLN